MSLVLRQLRLPLADFTLEVDVELQGRVTAIFGPSGAGKTSLLELVAGLRQPRSGSIRAGDIALLDVAAGINLPSRERRVGYVTQDLALFPHLSVNQNVLYGFKDSAAADSRFTAKHVCDLLEIGGLLERRIGSLSGGERQRVAFARALLAAPRLLLLDEPLASLDAPLKGRILAYLRLIRDEFAIPTLYVTHDATEVGALCDEVVRLERGQVVAQGEPSTVLV